VVEPPDNSIRPLSKNLSLPTGEGIVIDIGTGDGRFVFQCARRNPRKFFIGIDANPRPLEKLSEKIHRKPAKGGLPNVLFLQAAVEELPAELDGMADEIHIHFPWGSLLGAVATGNKAVLSNLRRVCREEALLEIIVGLDSERDRSELARLQINEFNADHIDSVLTALYREAGFEISERGEGLPLSLPQVQSSWARRLGGRSNRKSTYIIAQAI
jgi:16S rRNA (adenine(1408)-N(1))-methyltransferase